MKIKSSFVTHQNKDDYMMIDASGNFSGLVHSNKTTAFIVNCLREETDIESVVEKLLEKYDVTEEKAIQSVEMVVSKLREIGAIDD